MTFLDFLFPKYCVACKTLGSYLCTACFARLSFSQKTMCFLCGKYAIDGLTHPICKKPYALDGCFIALEYTSVIKKLIYVFKYKPYVTDVHRIMDELFYEALIEKEALMRLLSEEKERVLVPIPLHAKKLQSRGYNHAAILGKALAKKLSLPLVDIVIRMKETGVQFGLSKDERKENMKGAFAVKKGSAIEGKRYVG
jgi:predicted amidophosphoribosyltransferase